MVSENTDGFMPYEPSERLKRLLDANHEPGDYPWDRWYRKAVDAGLAEDLALLGRDVMREAIQHSWDEAVQVECGWDDDGEAMLQLALREPDQARQRWEYLVDTDGERCPHRNG